ncbi:MAG: TrmB family transcriptional regulator [Candidatus Woesearchaeota archaeon]|nr:MAG: TrmB family transcriptional regulator [Candidatus Woesearchaeota archaeon]
MIVKEEFLNKLRQLFHLNLYEVRIWTSLLSRGVSTAGELSDIGDVPRSRAYDVLESLEKKGFVVMKLGKPIKYIAVEPVEVVERVKKNIRNDAVDDVKKLENLRGTDVLKELHTLHTQGIQYVEPSDLSGALRGRHNVYAHMETMIKNAQKNISIMTTAKGLIRKVESLKPELERAAKKGVKVRIAAPISKENAAVAKELSKIADVRHLKDVKARFMLVDGKELVFMVLDDREVHPTYDLGVWVNTPFFTSAMEQMYDMSWEGLQKAGSVKV